MIGDTTYFTIVRRGSEEKDSQVLNHIRASASRESAWQIYLLSRSENVMPVMWHGAYRKKYFIFNEEDVNCIKPLQIYDVAPLSRNNLLLPEVTLSSGNDYANVYCTYWNDWKGLVREHVKICFHAENSVSLEECGSQVLFPYHCGILL